ncbi:hypothetical protein WJX73_009846 [Symbiochloris irregularis]
MVVAIKWTKPRKSEQRFALARSKKEEFVELYTSGDEAKVRAIVLKLYQGKVLAWEALRTPSGIEPVEMVTGTRPKPRVHAPPHVGLWALDDVTRRSVDKFKHVLQTTWVDEPRATWASRPINNETAYRPCLDVTTLQVVNESAVACGIKSTFSYNVGVTGTTVRGSPGFIGKEREINEGEVERGQHLRTTVEQNGISVGVLASPRHQIYVYRARSHNLLWFSKTLGTDCRDPCTREYYFHLLNLASEEMLRSSPLWDDTPVGAGWALDDHQSIFVDVSPEQYNSGMLPPQLQERARSCGAVDAAGHGFGKHSSDEGDQMGAQSTNGRADEEHTSTHQSKKRRRNERHTHVVHACGQELQLQECSPRELEGPDAFCFTRGVSVFHGTYGDQPCVYKVWEPLKARNASRQLVQSLQSSKALSDLQGSEVPRVLGKGTCYSSLLHFIAMEDAGRPLQKALDEGLSAEKACKEMLCVLHKVHSRGILHQDVEVRNWVERPDGRLCLVEWADAQPLTALDNAAAAAVMAEKAIVRSLFPVPSR